MDVLRNEDDMLDHYVSILEKAQDDPTNLMLLSVVAQGVRLCTSFISSVLSERRLGRPLKVEIAKYKRLVLNVAFGASRGTFYVHTPISVPAHDGVSPSMTRGPVRIYKSQVGNQSVIVKELHLGNKQEQETAQLCLALSCILSHPNLLPSLGADLTSSALRIASALCLSGNLREYIGVQRKEEAAQNQIIVEMIAGLRFLHSCGVVHANLKPENVLIWAPRPSPTGALVTLTDYGSKGGTSSSIEFRAPEVLNGAAPSEASDVFSLGMLTWMVLAWRSPEPPNPSPADLKELQKRLLEGKLPPIAPEWPIQLRRMIKKCDARFLFVSIDTLIVVAALTQETGRRRATCC